MNIMHSLGVGILFLSLLSLCGCPEIAWESRLACITELLFSEKFSTLSHLQRSVTQKGSKSTHQTAPSVKTLERNYLELTFWEISFQNTVTGLLGQFSLQCGQEP